LISDRKKENGLQSNRGRQKLAYDWSSALGLIGSSWRKSSDQVAVWARRAPIVFRLDDSLSTKGSHMPQDSHQRAAEFHELAAHAHRAAAAHHGKEDHQTGREHSRQALEHATTAFQYSQEAHQKSEKAGIKEGKSA
jgi:hypothetical protein